MPLLYTITLIALFTTNLLHFLRKAAMLVNILNYLKKVLTKKAMAHPKTQIVFSQLFSP
jgi:hypothetical protein